MKNLMLFLLVLTSTLACGQAVNQGGTGEKNVMNMTQLNLATNPGVRVIGTNAINKSGYLTPASIADFTNSYIIAPNYLSKSAYQGDTTGNYVKYRAGLLANSTALGFFQSKDQAAFYRDIDTAKAAKATRDTAAAIRTSLGKAANFYYVSHDGWVDSVNSASWVAKKNLAVRGSIVNTFPEPWSALRQAVADMKAGLVTNPVIYVLSGNTFSVGASSEYNPTQATNAIGKRYDTYNSDTTDVNSISLLYNNVTVIFEPNVTIIDNAINQQQVLFSDGNTSITANVYGKWNFIGNHGQIDGKFTKSIYAVGVNSKIYIECQKWDSKMGYSEGQSKAKEFEFKCDVMYSTTKQFITTVGSVDATVKITIGTVLTGKYAGAGYIVNDCWPFIGVGGVNGDLPKRCNIVIDIKQLAYHDDCDGFIYVQSLDSCMVTLKLGNIIQSSRDNGLTTPAYILNAQGGTWTNSTYVMTIDQYKGDMGVGQIQSNITNSKAVITCLSCESNNPVQPNKPSIRTWCGVDTLSSFVIEGNYRSISNPIVEIASASTVLILKGLYATHAATPAILLTTSAPKVILTGNISTAGLASISGTGVITIAPSATANVAVGSSVTTQGSALSVSPYFKN